VAKKTNTQVEAPNPALPFVPIVIDGITYKMVFDFGALAAAEEALLAKGFDANLLMAMVRRTFSTVRTLFAASLYAYQPEIDFNEAQNWVTQANIIEIMLAIDKAWKKSMPDADSEVAPPQPAE
jgi:hypothetical protein